MKTAFLTIISLLIIGNCYSQSTYKMDLGINGVSTAFILRDQSNNGASKGIGFNFTLSELSSNYRLTGQYTTYKKFEFDPTWKNMYAHKIELNLELTTHFENIEMVFYPFLGLSYNYISGFYTGINDQNSLRNYYNTNSVVTNRWPGLNFGMGLERRIKRVVIFANYRMHFVKAEDMIRIMDIGLDAGLKYNIDLKIPRRKKKIETPTEANPTKKVPQPKKNHFRRLFMPKERYNLN